MLKIPDMTFTSPDRARHLTQLPDHGGHCELRGSCSPGGDRMAMSGRMGNADRRNPLLDPLVFQGSS